ncbi:YihY/virulence factor BrkB family protein [Alicyclobacillus fastidiosus]|uniref:YihY/virulence factor BrkB family protein n=1 Tax=Alicyclobacillus fastidiosus TaxID=392011 RepID=A0ABV5AGH6_9BACL|nr:YihY/virulence factor BrkB family protein [Alicyclobacillus fastidiosus]WEH09522.1 YihY/virulence factor BrkB family protein [Alicyclobacillus fastidiosus]
MAKIFLKTLIRSIIRHNIGYLAAVISYFAFTSMIPVALLLIYGTSLFISGTRVEQFFDQLLESYIPTMPNGEGVVSTTIHRLSTLGPVISVIGFASLLWGSIGGFTSLQQTLDTICETHHRRSFIKQYVVGFGMLGLLMAMIFVSLLVTTVSPEVVSALGNLRPTLWVPLAHASSRILFAITLFATCYFAYRFLPSNPLPHTALLIGAAVSTICIYISRELFVVYTHHLGNYELIYGALTYIMLFSFWIYIASIIFLFGMEMALAVYEVMRQRSRSE